MERRLPLRVDQIQELRALTFMRYRRLIELTVAMAHVRNREHRKRVGNIRYIGALELYEELLWSLTASLPADAPKGALDSLVPISSRLLAVN